MSGFVRVVGLGPGPSHWITPETRNALDEADTIVGYRTYLARLVLREGQAVHGSDNGDELRRAQLALELAEGGARVAVISGGDPGVFAMAAAVFEAIDNGPPAWRALDVTVLPGITAMLAASARLGAMLGNDFCAINLSDNLKPWALIEKRLAAASEADFVIALYNPASNARPEQIQRAFSLLRERRPGDTIVVFAKAIGRSDEEVTVSTLGQADPALADMRTLLLIGASTTRTVARANGGAWLYSPRSLP
jgi:precorrin-3B C17-methyltransferase